MLERASPSIECTTHFLLKTLEAPIKTRRNLGPTFWKHAGDDLDIPAWWPAYLQHIRKSVDPCIGVSRNQTYLNPHSGFSGLSDKRKDGRKPGSHIAGIIPRNHLEARTFTASSRRGQYPSPQPKSSERRRSYDVHSQFGGKNRDMSVLEAMGSSPTVSNLDPKRSDSTQMDGTAENYDGAWKLFVQSGHKKEVAGNMLHYLSGSQERADLRHALTVFDFIPVKQRRKIDYQTAIDVATRCQNYKIAVSLTNEALSRGWGRNAYFKLMAHCVDHTLWNTLAFLWKSSESYRRHLTRSRDRRGKSTSPNIAGDYAFHFDAVTDLPDKVIGLASRLSQKDAVLAANTKTLTEVCKSLAYITVENAKAMSTINGRGALALFQVQQQLDFNSKLHLAAIGTIRKMQDKGSKAQLAILIYRNFGFTYPDIQVPMWVYGALIAICTAARESPRTYQFLLDDIAKWYGRADDWSLQQVMSACARQGEVEAVFKTFTEFCKVSKPKDVRDVNHLLHVFAVTGDAGNTKIQFDRLKSDFGFTPDVVSWTLLLLAHARSSEPNSAFRVFDQMENADMKPNSVSWSILINIAAARGDTARARQLYDKAKMANVPVSIHMLGSIVESLLLNDKAAEAESLVLKAGKDDLFPSPIRLWNSLFRYYAFRADAHSIHRIQGMMKNLSIKPDAMTYAALMTALVVKGQTSDAATILRTLHFSQHLNPTEFHYSILIHGFALEGQRQMATTVYNEMLEHFPRATASAKLAMLQLQLQKEARKKGELTAADLRSPATVDSSNFIIRETLELLRDRMADDPRSDTAPALPNPGFRRTSARNSLEAMYLGSLISFLQQQDAHEASNGLLNTMRSLASSNKTPPTIAISTLTLTLNAAAESQHWSEVDGLWSEILARGSKAFAADPETADATVISHKQLRDPKLVSSGQVSNANTIVSGENVFQSMLPVALTSKETSTVLRAHRFALSWPLSLLLQALDQQQRHHDAVLAIRDFQAFGFQLSGRNWNRYIQILTKSSNFDHCILAFTMFEKHLLPHAPPWDVMRRGKWLSPHQSVTATSDPDVKPVSRKLLERRSPASLMPSYFTMIHLAAALTRSHRLMISGDPSQLRTLQENAPGTFNLIRKIPYLADRVQGVLLRNRSVIGDRVARSRAAHAADEFSGIKGSKAALDNVPPSVLQQLEELLTLHDHSGSASRLFSLSSSVPVTSGNARARYAEHIRRAEARSGMIERTSQYIPDEGRFESTLEANNRISAQESMKLQPILDLAEKIMGDIHRGPQFLAAQGRLETEKEVRQRILLQTVQRLDMIDQLRLDLRSTTLSNTAQRGEATARTYLPPIEPPTEDNDRRIQADEHSAMVQSLTQLHMPAGNDRNNVKSNGDHPGLESDVNHQQQSFVEGNAQTELAHTRGQRKSTTSTLRRRVVPVYRTTGDLIPKRLEPRRRGAWSINKDIRRQRLQEKQLQARWDRRMREGLKTRKGDNPGSRQGVFEHRTKVSSKQGLNRRRGDL